MRWNELFCPKETKHVHDVWWVRSCNEWCLKVEYIKHINSSLNTFLHIIYFYFWDDTIKYLLLFVS